VGAHQATTTSASISTSMRSSMKRETSSSVVAGADLPEELAVDRPDLLPRGHVTDVDAGTDRLLEPAAERRDGCADDGERAPGLLAGREG